MDDRKGRVDQVFLFHFFALDDEVFQQVEEIQLPAAERGVGADELVKSSADGFRKTFQHFDAENMADELDKARFAVFVDLAQQIFGDMRVFFVQQFGQFVGFFGADRLAVLDLLQHRVVFGQFGNQGLDHFPVAGDADGLVLRAEFHPFLLVQFIGQIKMGLALAGALLAEFHQRAEFGGQFIEGIFVGLGPVVVGLRGADQGFFLLLRN